MRARMDPRAGPRARWGWQRGASPIQWRTPRRHSLPGATRRPELAPSRGSRDRWRVSRPLAGGRRGCAPRRGDAGSLRPSPSDVALRSLPWTSSSSCAPPTPVHCGDPTSSGRRRGSPGRHRAARASRWESRQSPPRSALPALRTVRAADRLGRATRTMRSSDMETGLSVTNSVPSGTSVRPCWTVFASLAGSASPARTSSRSGSSEESLCRSTRRSSRRSCSWCWSKLRLCRSNGPMCRPTPRLWMSSGVSWTSSGTPGRRDARMCKRMKSLS